MPKKFIEKYMPKPEVLKQHKYLKVFGQLLNKPNLWALNRKSAPGAFAIGLFAAWMPMPFQMVLAAALAIFFNVNIPVSVALVWLTNPLTMPFMFYGAYLLGAKILGTPAQEFQFQISWAWIEASLSTIGPPFILGCAVLGVICAIAGYFIIANLWKYSILFKWQKRNK
ncbi:DUF2062 domain-containing protein [Shewanella intestini]|uniref:DUF2062 domain-containing protein n=1 Tax=Shewanella intestini TaxID=2017544 RepID=A0ABS5HZL8_9GAMM|nr:MULTISPECIES: DUF2062 domain-containing protein [Shewanella]MBR9727023.1 DUF2062 domain-containing protein [Shewanella intestini]MRG35824.1 DUF2062 domain-containing protein [Shewanella sp. XMDDZSB0408]